MDHREQQIERRTQDILAQWQARQEIYQCIALAAVIAFCGWLTLSERGIAFRQAFEAMWW